MLGKLKNGFLEILNMEKGFVKMRLLKFQWIKNYDLIFVAIGIIYAIVPITIFALGWLKCIYSIPISALLIFLGIKIWQEIIQDSDKIKIFSKENVRFWIISTSLVIIWVYLSGIGSFVFQNEDHWVRNPIFRDLSTLKWPIIYDLSKESAIVQEICGNTKVAFSYYFSWWLPISGLSKLLHLPEVLCNFLLFFWALTGIFVTIYLICRKLNKCSWIIPVCFILFSGLDYIPTKLLEGEIESIAHIEWWAKFFQYSSNTTLLFWVFNQAIPIWVIMALFLQMKDNKYIASLSSLTFAYSPWATFGMIPLAIISSLKKNQIRNAFNLLNFIVPGIMLIVFGSFYLGGGGSEGEIGFIFLISSADYRRVLINYLMFILFEFLIYFLIVGKHAYYYELYKTVLIELLVFPLIVIRDGNFIMRGTIPALFMLSYYVITFLLDKKNERKNEIRIRYSILIIALVIGSITPIHEINRTVKNTMQSNDMLQEMIGSFSDIQTGDDDLITIIKNQFFVYDYDSKFFFKYLAK